MTKIALNLQVALATYPKYDIEKYKERIEHYHTKFKTDTEKYLVNGNSSQLNGLYEPETYHIFGNYDVAFVSLTHSLKFSQRLFCPNYDNSSLNLDANAYQILTGLCVDGNPESPLETFEPESTLETFKKATEKKFICISSLKFSNGFLIGNGRNLTKPTLEKINEKLKDKFTNACWLFFQSFSWFEVSIVFFTDSTDDFAKFLHLIRELGISEIKGSDKIIADSLYTEYKDKKATKKEDKVLKNYHVFSDTQSHIGVRFDVLKGETLDDKLKTQIEWITKPGQLGNLREKLKEIKIEENTPIFKTNPSETVALTGKTDYWFEENLSEKLSNNQALFKQTLNNNGDDPIRNYFRNYRTRLLLGVDDNDTRPKPSYSDLHEPSPLKKLQVSHKDINKVYTRLTALKVSRHIRQKVNKLFFNFNVGINDPILYIYFLDLHNFVRQLQKTIGIEHEYFKDNFLGEGTKRLKTVYEIEQILENFIRVFSEANTIRGLNGYAFEEIYDFDLDLNSSCQQLLTTYNTIVTTLGNDLIGGGNHPQVVQLNLHNTESNDLSVSYNVYHLINGPEFVLAAIVKEVLNSRFKENGNVLSDMNKGLQEEFNKSENPLIKDWLQDGIIRPDYYLSDALRVMLIFNFDIDLYAFWLRMFNFQNTSLYSTVGVMDEQFFKQELFRLVFVMNLFDPTKAQDLKSPIPELASYWERHYDNVKKAVSKFTTDEIRVRTLNGLVATFCDRIEAVNYTKLLIKGFSSYDPLVDFDKKMPLLKFRDLSFWGAGYIQNRMTYFLNFKEHEFGNGCEPVIFNEEKHHNPAAFLYAMSYAYLKLLYDENDGKIHLLKRDWKNGKVIEGFLKHQPPELLFSVDAFGGLFFSNFDQKNKYYAIRNTMLQSLWHLSLLIKKDFILKPERP